MELLEAVIGGLPITVLRTGVIGGPAYNGSQRLRESAVQGRSKNAAQLGLWKPTNIKEEETLLQENYRPLQTPFQRTPTRSWAPSGPVRIQCAAELRTRHRA